LKGESKVEPFYFPKPNEVAEIFQNDRKGIKTEVNKQQTLKRLKQLLELSKESLRKKHCWDYKNKVLSMHWDPRPVFLILFLKKKP